MPRRAVWIPAALFIGAVNASLVWRFLSFWVWREPERYLPALLAGTLTSAATCGAAAALIGRGAAQRPAPRGDWVWGWFWMVGSAAFVAPSGVLVSLWWSSFASRGAVNGASADPAQGTAILLSLLLALLAGAAAVPLSVVGAAATLPFPLILRSVCSSREEAGGSRHDVLSQALLITAAAVVCAWLGGSRVPDLLKRAGYAAWCYEAEVASATSPDRRHHARAVIWDCVGATSSSSASVTVERLRPWPVRAFFTLLGIDDDVELLAAADSHTAGLRWESNTLLVIDNAAAAGRRWDSPWRGIRFTYDVAQSVRAR